MADTKHIQVYDTTLRDGCQSEDISLTVEDKVTIAERLDDLGFDYIEGGWPGSNDRDAAFFKEVKKIKIRHAKIAAFGSPRRSGVRAAADRKLQLLLRTGAPVATVVGKTWDMHVREALRIPLNENLEIVNDTIAFLKKNFDEAVTAARAAVNCPIGIHCHNDSEVAVANTLAGVRAGAVQVQGTINGFGERCGNANLVSIVANLQLKLGYHCVPPAKLKTMREISTLVYELANITPFARQPYVGRSAFAHKGGLHVSGIQRNTATYEHIDPALLGNDRRVLLSELSGRANIVYKAKEFGLEINTASDDKIGKLLDELKRLEGAGYTFDGADASFELLMLRTLGFAREHFNFVSFRVFDDKWHEERAPFSEAVVVIEGPDGVRTRNSAIGNGPVNALDSALRSALVPYYPSLEAMQLVDYKVRVLDNGAGTEARVRVLIESTDGKRRWGTVGLSSNVVEASWQALVDSVEYKLHKDNAKPRSAKAASKSNGARPRSGRTGENSPAAHPKA